MARKRTLKDLYVRGKEVVLDDGDGAITVWVQKPNPVEYSQILRKADAARSRIAARLRDEDSDEYQAALGDLMATDHENLVVLLSGIERGRIDGIIRAETADEEKWKENNYLIGLFEAWGDGLEQKFIDDPEDKEAAEVKAELQRYADDCEANLEYRMETFTEGLKVTPLAELQDLVKSHNLKLMGDVAWMTEFYRQQVFLGTRDAQNHSEHLFEERSDVDELQEEVFEVLSSALREVMVDPVEGKDSAGNPPS